MKCFIERTRGVQLVLEPERQALPKQPKAQGRTGNEGLDQPVELEQRFVIERYETKLFIRDAGRAGSTRWRRQACARRASYE